MSAPDLEPTTPSTVNAKMFSTGQFTDLTVKCNGQECKVHRSVVCLQSKPIHTAITHFKEGSTGIYEILDSEPEIVYHFLKYLYTGNYSDVDDATKEHPNENDSIPSASSKFSKAENNPLVTNVKVYVLADTYDVQPLKKLAMEKYKKALEGDFYLHRFTDSLQLLYESTLKESSTVRMRHAVAKEASKHISSLVHNRRFNELCEENGEISFDILQASLGVGWAGVADIYSIPSPRCPDCNTDASVSLNSSTPLYFMCEFCFWSAELVEDLVDGVDLDGENLDSVHRFLLDSGNPWKD